MTSFREGGTNRERRTYFSHGDSNKPCKERNHNPTPNKCCRACILQTRTKKWSDSSEKGHRWERYSQSFEQSLHKQTNKKHIYKLYYNSFTIKSYNKRTWRICTYHLSSKFLLVTKLVETLLSCIHCSFFCSCHLLL